MKKDCNLLKRIEIAVNNRQRIGEYDISGYRSPPINQKVSNCIGTAFFLAGVLDEDKAVSDIKEIDRYLSTYFRGIAIPEHGAIISFDFERISKKNGVESRIWEPEHMGLITGYVEPHVIHRKSHMYPLEIVPLSDLLSHELIQKDVQSGYMRVRYYRRSHCL